MNENSYCYLVFHKIQRMSEILCRAVVERVVAAAEGGKVNAKENRKEKHEHKRHGKTCKNL